MRYLFLLTFLSLMSTGMLMTPSRAPHAELTLLTQELTQHANTVGFIKSSLWKIKGLLVFYQNNQVALENLVHHAFDLKDLYLQINHECMSACNALGTRDLAKLIKHSQAAQLLYADLHNKAAIFDSLVANMLQRSKL